jgi:hypothetical protein
MTKPVDLREELKNIIFTFQVRSVIQEAQPVKDIPEIDSGELTGKSINKLLTLFQQQLIGAIKKENKIWIGKITNPPQTKKCFCIYNQNHKRIGLCLRCAKEQSDVFERGKKFMSDKITQTINNLLKI